MQLYLSSYRLGDLNDRLARMVGSRQLAFIPNGLDFVEDPESRNAVIHRGTDDLHAIGLGADIIDLREYFGAPERLAEKLFGYGAVFVAGGNVFVLRRALRQSGLDQFLVAMQADADFVYAGYSAGACVCAPTLRGLELVDDSEIAPDAYDRGVIWDGLSLIDFCIAPHFRSDHPESEAIESVVEHYRASEMPFRPLRDCEVVLLDA